MSDNQAATVERVKQQLWCRESVDSMDIRLLLEVLDQLKADLLASQEECTEWKDAAEANGSSYIYMKDKLTTAQLEVERLMEALQAFDDAYADIRQLQQGFMHSGGQESWSDWDKQVEQTTIAVGEKVRSALALTAPTLQLEYQRLRHDALYYRAFRAMRMKQSEKEGGFWAIAIGNDANKFDTAMLADYEFHDAMKEQEALSTPSPTDALAAHDTKGIDNGQG